MAPSSWYFPGSDPAPCLYSAFTDLSTYVAHIPMDLHGYLHLFHVIAIGLKATRGAPLYCQLFTRQLQEANYDSTTIKPAG